MKNYHHHILIDSRTSCSRDEAAAILLGRRTYDPIYPDSNPGGDTVKIYEKFMEWLDISIFEVLSEERDDIALDLDDAIDIKNQQKIDECRYKIMKCDDTIRRAKLILCDIDDELAKGTQSRLRIDQLQTKQSGKIHITFTSLKAWSSESTYSTQDVEAAKAQPSMPDQRVAGQEEPLLNSKGGMSPTMANSFLVTFALLLEAFMLKTGNVNKSESGTGIKLNELASHLNKISLPGGREGTFLDGQSVSSIETRINAVLEVSTHKLSDKRISARKSK